MRSLQTCIDQAIEQALPSCSPQFSKYIHEPCFIHDYPTLDALSDEDRISFMLYLGRNALAFGLSRFFKRESLSWQYHDDIKERLLTPDVFTSLMDFERVPAALELVDPSLHIPLLAYGMISPLAPDDEHEDSDKWFTAAVGPAVRAAHEACILYFVSPSTSRFDRDRLDKKAEEHRRSYEVFQRIISDMREKQPSSLAS